MRISYKGDYALKAILDLAQYYNEPVTIYDIAKRQDIPVKFLEQILLQLKREGFLISRRGAKGGYLLSRPPKKIILGDVIRVIDGPIAPITCVSKNNRTQCDFSVRCVLYDIFEQVRDQISKIVDNVTFADLVKMTEQKTKKGLDFSI